MTAVILLLIVEILPMFSEILTSLGGEMPGFTTFILNIGLALGQYFWLLLIVIIGLVVSGKYYQQNRKRAVFL